MPSSGHFKNSSAAVTMESSDGGDSMENYNMDTKNGNNDSHQNTKPITSFDPIEYVQRTRITKPVFAKPAADPLQFIKVKPCNLYQSAQEQLKKAEEVKKVKEIKKEEPEDWQSNLDNWKSSRRKRVEHIIDRVVEVKKFEMEDFDRTRRKSKTFSEMLEERGTRGNKVTLPVYTEDDANDLTDLGIGTSSTSCKSSVSEDFDNHSVVSDSQESTHNSSNNNDHHNNDNNSDYDNPSPINNISSSQNSCEYTYEGAIQGYKTRISTKFQSSNFSNKIQTATSDNNTEKFYNFSNRFAGGGDKFIKSQEKLFSNNNCEIENNNNNNNDINTNLPKIDISKKKELFENRTQSSLGGGATTEIIKISPKVSQEFSQSKSIKERLSNFGRRDSEEMPPKESTKVEVEQVVSLKDRLSNFEKQIINEKPTVASNVPSKIDVPIVSLKDRLSSLQSNISPDVKTPPQKDEDKIECTTTTTPTNSNVVNSNRCIVFEMNNHRVSTQQHFNSNVNHVDETMLPKVEIEQKIEPELKKSEYFKARNELKLVINEDPVSVDEVEPEDEVASNQPIDEHEISVIDSGKNDLVADNNSVKNVTLLKSHVSSNNTTSNPSTSLSNHSLIENIAELCEKVEYCKTSRKPMLSPPPMPTIMLDTKVSEKIPSLSTSPFKNIELNATKNFNSMLAFMKRTVSSPSPPAECAGAAAVTATSTIVAPDDEIVNVNLRKLDDVLNSIEHLHLGVDEILDEELNKLDLEDY